VKKFQILGLKKQIDYITEEVIKNSNIELLKKEKLDKKALENGFKCHIKSNPYKERFKKLETIMDTLNISKESQNLNLNQLEDINLDELDEMLETIKNRIDKLDRILNKMDREEKRVENTKKHVYLMRNMDIQLEELKNLKFISLIFGSLEKERYHRLIENISNQPILILEVNEDQQRIWFFAFSRKEDEEQTLKILKSVNFEKIELPRRVNESPRTVLKQAESRLEKINIIREQIDLEYKKLFHRYHNQLSEYYQKILFLNKIRSIDNEYYDESCYFFLAIGWIPEDREKEFKDKLEREYPNILYSSREVEDAEEENPPTILDNPNWIKGFSSLVKLYGLPSYNELDPSIFFAATYLLLFGMMFGDVGQGFVFALIGYLISKEMIKFVDKDLGFFFMGLGSSSMFFGLIYGSVFGLENIIPALIFRPMENIMFWLGFTTVLGIMLLIISMLFNLINSFKNKDYEEALFSESGLSGLSLYLLILISAAFFAIKRTLLIPLPYTLTAAALLLIFIFFKKPLGNYFEGKGFAFGKPIGEFFLESVFEIFDTVLSYMSNTLSFLRVGAFTLNHIGLSMAFILLSEMIQNHIGSILILIIGNLVIMTLEAVVVGIQILRLEFFEIFAKFYRGTGREFDPIKLD